MGNSIGGGVPVGALKSERDVDTALSEIKRVIGKGERVSVELLESVAEYAVERAIKLELSVVDAYEKGGGVIVIVLERRFF
ncbi:MAG: hypothetical protein LM571_01600 [Desulfurococcaceae archaeon]|jgi:glutamate-1-semialdehyde aminotransferase|nr:hypothetical protein [Desulfurococcaceae archaeon]